MLGVSPTSIKRWSNANQLPVHKTAGGHRRYRRQDVEALLRPDTATPSSLAARLASMSRSEIDRLPVGVVRIADDGTVVLYNRTESDFSGIPTRQAEGQHFFTQLAPCTNNSIVYGRFRDGVKKGELDVKIAYTFTYRMRPTNVTLHLYRDGRSGTNWLTVDPS